MAPKASCKLMSDSKSQLLKLLEKWQLNNEVDKLLLLKRESLKLNLSPTGELETTNSRLGGKPSVPKDFEWPEDSKGPLSFIAQVKILKDRAYPGLKPSSDYLLSFFYNNYNWGFSQSDKDTFRVYKFSLDQKLELRNPPKLEKKKALFGLISKEPVVKAYKACTVESEVVPSLPMEIDIESFTDADWDNYFELTEDIDSGHKMFGYPEQIQGEIELECEYVARGYEPMQKVDAKELKEIEVAKNRWQLLLQIDSDTENSNMMWGDGGKLYFMIDQIDLEKEIFSDCWLISQCH